MKAPANMKIGLIACLVLLAGGYIAGSAIQAAGDHKAVVMGLSGVVDVQKSGTTQWIPAEKGMELSAGDTLRTTIDSIVDIQLDDGSALRLAEETKMTIEGLSTDAEKARFLYFFNRPVEARKAKLKLAEGKILANVKKMPNSQSSFRVETPKGVAGVRGTNWFVGTKELGVQEGFINWTRNQDEKQKQQSWETVVRAFFAGPNKKEHGDESDVARTRVNEGLAAKIAEDGALVDWSVVPEQELVEMKDFFQKVYTEGLPATVSQTASNNYTDEQIVPSTISGSTLSDPGRHEDDSFQNPGGGGSGSLQPH